MGCNLLELLTLVVFFKVCNSSFHIFLIPYRFFENKSEVLPVCIEKCRSWGLSKRSLIGVVVIQ